MDQNMDSKLRMIVMGQQAVSTTPVGVGIEAATPKACIGN
jgi:hypothetical protein